MRLSGISFVVEGQTVAEAKGEHKMTVQTNLVQGDHKCKSHNYEHFYVRHTCGHEFCPFSWLYCPRCHGSHEGNRIQPIGRTASEYGNDEIRWPDGLQHY